MRIRWERELENQQMSGTGDNTRWTLNLLQVNPLGDDSREVYDLAVQGIAKPSNTEWSIKHS
jgi:hypothetical protein